MKKKETEFLTEEEAEAILRVPDRRTFQGKDTEEDSFPCDPAYLRHYPSG